MNLSDNNYADLCALVDLLDKAINDKNIFRIYTHLLFEIENCDDVKKKNEITKRQMLLDEKIRTMFINSNVGTPLVPYYHNCQASGGTAIVIAPDGTLYPCEHISECEECGTIYNSNDMLLHTNDWQRLMKRTPLCSDCPVYPVCFRKEKCPATPTDCWEMRRERARVELINDLRNIEKY